MLLQRPDAAKKKSHIFIKRTGLCRSLEDVPSEITALETSFNLWEGKTSFSAVSPPPPGSDGAELTPSGLRLGVEHQ